MGLFFCLFVVCCYAKLKINGLVLVSYQQTNETNSAMRMLQDAFSIVGPNGWVSIVVQFTQSNINSTSINVSADSLSRLQESVNAAKSLGLHVIVKPHVDLSQDPLHWRGEIGKYFDDAAWAAWFSSYKSMMKSVAGSSKGAEALNIGTELTLTQSREQNWRDVISLARNFFPGILCYGSNHGNESSIKWWDALDWIGVDAYYPLGNDSSVDALVQSWNGIFSTILNPLAAKFKKPIVFTEVGYQSVTGAAITPWAAHGALSVETQERCYLALYQAAASNKNLVGVQFWAFTDLPQDGGALDSGFSMHNKPSAAVVSWQGQPQKKTI